MEKGEKPGSYPMRDEIKVVRDEMAQTLYASMWSPLSARFVSGPSQFFRVCVR